MLLPLDDEDTDDRDTDDDEDTDDESDDEDRLRRERDDVVEAVELESGTLVVGTVDVVVGPGAVVELTSELDDEAVITVITPFKVTVSPDGVRATTATRRGPFWFLDKVPLIESVAGS